MTSLAGAAKVWITGARPKTLPAAVVPVAVGTAVAVGEGPIIWWRAVAAMVVAVALQVATNYVNDYADGKRGTDDSRVGPVRLVGSGLASAGQVKSAAVVAFGLAGAAGVLLAVAVGPELLIIGAVSMVAGWAYTGGPRPYGYVGLGELFVFAFFGVVATCGSTYVQIETVTSVSWLASIPVGLLAVALLVINNLRDIPTDRESNKKTLAVRMGDRLSRLSYVFLFVFVAVGVAACAFWRPAAVIGIAGLLFAVTPVRDVLRGATGDQLIGVLAATGRTQLITGALFAFGLALT